MPETLNLFQQALWLAVVMSAPPLIVLTVLGIAISFLQAVTQVQDQTLAYVVKLVGIAVVLMSLGRWYMSELMKIWELAFALISSVGR